MYILYINLSSLTFLYTCIIVYLSFQSYFFVYTCIIVYLSFVYTCIIVYIAFQSYFCGNNKRTCLLYTSDAADDMQCVDLGGRRIIKKEASCWQLP